MLENRIKILESMINKERKEKPEELEGEESAKKEAQKYKELYEEAVQRYSKSKQKIKHLQLALHTMKGRNAQDQTSKAGAPGLSSSNIKLYQFAIRRGKCTVAECSNIHPSGTHIVYK
ncbi:hypothetical protein BS50DRAFT_634988 [Corynespora cassiicola Philippines]|uniref:Uncharacterized protein n=1 Tax=Corynespora cassiicola Philippines TaxID=1448308 RepID=A0A2T2NKI5_CORCC|nr:hypothetical protein BS50DRAFT_634988 [Corynespora cassiicola Philippines]